MSATPLISLQDITKVFLADDMETHALSGIQLQVAAGEFISIAGPSGCGKSTLLSIIGLLEPPTDGTYLLDGEDTSGFNSDQRARLRNRSIGFIFQNFNLIGEMTILENVALPLAYRGISRAKRTDLARDALSKVDMLHRQQHLPAQLSGGQQQRIAVARAIAGAPSLLLADEPTGNLDSRNGSAVMRLLSELNATGTTICMVTHDERYARMAQRIIHLFDGKIVNESTSHDDSIVI